jgi:hypothetical protein
MKKKSLLFLICCSFLCAENSFSQGGVWTWISGVSSTGSNGVFGTQGIPSVSNYPPGLYEFADWKDKQGNFWLYGGFAPDYSDLWKYNPSTNEWTWVKGNGQINQNAVYGTQGVPNAFNSPGVRTLVSATWVDTTGNLWLFGGSFMNDLWMYNIATNEWTWMSGSTTPYVAGEHGVKGVPSILNVPGARIETCSGWTDSANNLWLFGGTGTDDLGFSGDLNDVMRYNISTNEWTWMAGSDLANASYNYGTKGVSSPTNDPGGRLTYTKWKDLSGNFWLMGGARPDYRNDVWKYDVAINEWTWMAGTDLASDAGMYPGTCGFAPAIGPAGRFEHRSSTTDNCGRFWLFGGAHQQIQFNLEDLWVFDPATLNWNWMSGTYSANLPGNYGVMGVPAATNQPPSRYGAISWWGDDDRFYMYGGNQNNTGPNFSDLWVFTPDTSCITFCSTLPVALLSAPNTICPGTCTDFSNQSFNAVSYQWSFPGAIPAVSSDVNPTNICYAVSGSYDVQLIATNAAGSDTLFLPGYVTVYAIPPPQSITQSGDTLFAIPGASAYQWNFNSAVIPGATEFYYVAPAGGNYSVVATDSNGCEVEAAIFDVIAEVPSAIADGPWTIFPNPVGEFVVISSEFGVTASSVSVFNVLGEKIYTAVGRPPITVNCEHFSPGLYFLEITSNEKSYRSKFVKR